MCKEYRAKYIRTICKIMHEMSKNDKKMGKHNVQEMCKEY